MAGGEICQQERQIDAGVDEKGRNIGLTVRSRGKITVGGTFTTLDSQENPVVERGQDSAGIYKAKTKQKLTFPLGNATLILWR